MITEQESCSCYLCGSRRINIKANGRERIHKLPGDFQIHECIDCGLIFTYPQLNWNDIKRYYPDTYIPHNIVHSSLLGRILDNHRHAWMKTLVKKYKQSGVLLDIGCGTGSFLNYISLEHNWELIGIEPSKTAVNNAIIGENVRILNKKWEDMDFPDNSFDCITMWHVFEHISNPKECLLKIHNLLKPNGVLIMAMPNSKSFNARLFGKYWSGYDVPRHYFSYSPPTITRLLLDSKFEYPNIHSYIGGFGAFNISMSFLIDDINWPECIKKSILKLFSTNICRALLFPYTYIANVTGHGTNMVVETRKVK